MIFRNCVVEVFPNPSAFGVTRRMSLDIAGAHVAKSCTDCTKITITVWRGGANILVSICNFVRHACTSSLTNLILAIPRHKVTNMFHLTKFQFNSHSALFFIGDISCFLYVICVLNKIVVLNWFTFICCF